MLELLANYYEIVAKITYGAEYLVDNDSKQDTFDRYNALLNNIGVLHSKIKQLKEEKGLTMFNFNNIQKDSIYIENGFLVGNIEKGREDAYSLVSNFKHEEPISEKNLEEYELGLLVLNLSNKVKESYIAPKSEINKIVEEENNQNDSTKNTTLVEFNVDELKKDKDDKKTKKEIDNKKEKQPSDVMQFSMFSNL